MIGEYSINQMDDFYDALGHGHVKPTGIMNYLQHLLVAQRCPAGARVVDVCCGRGLQVPILIQHAPTIAAYVGLDIAASNLAEARTRQACLRGQLGPPPFTMEFVRCDVAQPWPVPGGFDVAIYTSALEHLPREAGIASLHHTARALAAGGTLYLSTPNTPGTPPRLLQHGVHVYEWHASELVPVLEDAGLVVEDQIGLLPPSPEELAVTLERTYGLDAAAWYRAMAARVPEAFLGAVVAAAVPEAAIELLYVCRKP